MSKRSKCAHSREFPCRALRFRFGAIGSIFSRQPPMALLLLLISLVPIVSPAQTNLAVLTSDGAWTWFNDPRALFHNGALYFGYVRSADGKSVLSAFQPTNGLKTDLWTSSLTQTDDHNNPGLLV